MTLAQGVGAMRKIGLAEHGRSAEKRSRHSDIVVEGKCANQRRRCLSVGREVSGELGPRLQLNHGDKGFEHLVEQFELLPRMATGAGDK
jgi:hypothetical protein